jgi:hypothetical protein
VTNRSSTYFYFTGTVVGSLYFFPDLLPIYPNDVVNFTSVGLQPVPNPCVNLILSNTTLALLTQQDYDNTLRGFQICYAGPPTPSPTVSCDSGEVYDAYENDCESCDSGRYADAASNTCTLW